MAGQARLSQLLAKARMYGCALPLTGSWPGVRRGVGGYSVGPYARCFLGCIDKRMWGSPAGPLGGAGCLTLTSSLDGKIQPFQNGLVFSCRLGTAGHKKTTVDKKMEERGAMKVRHMG